MTLLLIVRKLWRYKLATLPILGLVLAAAFFEIAVKPDMYQASATYILVTPPAPPTPDEIARDPKLGKGIDNPYTRYSDQSVVVQVLASRLNGDDTHLALAKQGADPNYTVQPSSEFGSSAPIVSITGTGTSPASAIKTAEVVGLALTRELDDMQKVHGVAPRYRIDTQEIVGAHDARLKASGKLRAGVAVIALGTVMLFIVVSILDGLVAFRRELATARARGAEVGADAADLPPDVAEGVSRREWDDEVPARGSWPAAIER
jgi:capsular polysaccharide biosynthesis protein